MARMVGGFSPRASRFTTLSHTSRATVFRLLGLLSFGGWVYVFFFSPWLEVREIDIRGAGDSRALRGDVYRAIDQQNHFLISPRHVWFIDLPALEKTLTQDWFAERVTIERSLSNNVLRLNVVERTNRLVLVTEDAYFWVDRKGLILSELRPDERQAVLQRMTGREPVRPSDPLILRYNPPEDVTIGYRVADEEDMTKWLSMNFLLLQKKIDYRYLDLTQSGDEQVEARLWLQDGTATYLNTRENVLGQLNALAVFLAETNPEKKRRSGLQGVSATVNSFIDVRIPGRIYIK